MLHESSSIIRHTIRRFLLPGLLALAMSASAREANVDPTDHWLETRLGGTPAGFLHERSSAADNGQWRTKAESRVVLNRMGSQVEIRSSSEYLEDDEGHLRRVNAQIGSSAEMTEVTAEITDDVLRQRATAGGQSYDTETALDAPLLGPRGIRERSRQSLRAAGDRIEYATFSGDFAAMTIVTREVIDTDTLDIDGESVATVVVLETLAVMPVPSRIWLDAAGRTLRMQQDSPFGLIESIRSDAGVQQRVAAGAELPEETYQNAVARSNIRLPRPRSLEQVRLRIDLKRADSVMPALDGPHQTMLERGERHAIVEIGRGEEPRPGAASERENGAAFLVPNAWLQSDHPEVKALADSLRQPGVDDYTQARLLQDWVSTHMEFDAGIALLSASEAVRDRRGTCVAYAVLLTSLTRALDIPSRVVMGYIYAANMWGGHAWTEVLVDGQWIALDAAVWRAGPADAARIGVLRTSLENGSVSGIAELSQLYGNERITVLAYTLDGNETRVATDAAAYTVDGRDYHNPSLGLRLSAPDGFTFAELDIMYPRSDVLVLRDETDSTIVLQQRSLHLGEAADPDAVLRARGFEPAEGQAPATLKVSGRTVRMVRNARQAAAIWQDDSDLWLLHGTGASAVESMPNLLRDGISMDAP